MERFYVLMADFTMGNGTFYRNGVNFGECDVLTTHSRESDVLTTHSLTSHFIGKTSASGSKIQNLPFSLSGIVSLYRSEPKEPT